MEAVRTRGSIRWSTGPSPRMIVALRRSAA